MPSFYGKRPKLGALLESGYVTLVDDFLRFFDQQALKHKISPQQALRIGLGQIFNLLDREMKAFPSGKETLRAQYLASFFATDNMKYKQAVRLLWKEDKALVRRFSFLRASKETEKRGVAAYMETAEAVSHLEKRFASLGLSFTLYRLLGVYLRERMKVAKISEKRVTTKSRELDAKYGVPLYFLPKLRALLKFCVVIKRIIPSFADDMFDRMAERLAHDFAELVLQRTPPSHRE